MKRFLFIMLFAAAAQFAGPFATDASSGADIETMDLVVVTATRQEEEISTLPAHITVLTSEEIAESPAETVPELLRTAAGVLVNDINGSGRTYIVDLRGYGETAALNTLVLIDGRRINQPDLSGVDWTLIPKDRVERIEIVYGGRGSVLYGDNAGGGVINIITKKGAGDPETAVKVTAGSYMTYQGQVSARTAINDVSFAMSGNYRTSDGYRDNSDTTAKDIGLNVAYDVTERLSLRFDGGYHDDESNLPGALTQSDLDSGVARTNSLHPNDYSDTEDWYLQAGLRFFLTGNNYLDLDASHRDRETKFFSFFDAGEYVGQTEIETLAVSPKLVFNEHLLERTFKLVFGFDYEKSTEEIFNKSTYLGFPSVTTYDLRKKNSSYYTHGEYSLTDKLTLSGGYRKDQVTFTYKAIELGTEEKKDLDEDLYTAGLNYSLTDQTSFYSSYSKSFRYPVLDESFNFVSNTINSQLDGQTADNYELGLRHKGASGIVLSMNLFRIVTENEIFYNPTTFANENLDGDGIRQGLEVAIQKEIQGMLFNGSYTYRDAEIDGGQFDGNALPNVPRHQATLGAQREFGRQLRLNLEGTYVGERPFVSDFGNKHADQEDYVYLTGKISYLLARGVAYLAVKNILDETYAEYGVLTYLGEKAFYPSPGINFLAGIDLTF